MSEGPNSKEYATPISRPNPALPIGGGESELKEQDRYLPVANISRIMKKVLPDNAKVAKDAKETVQECVSEFVCFITSEASDKCQQEKRKTINGEDILWAMSTLGFDKYVEPLKTFLGKYRDSVKVEKPEKKYKRAESSEPTIDSPELTPSPDGTFFRDSAANRLY